MAVTGQITGLALDATAVGEPSPAESGEIPSVVEQLVLRIARNDRLGNHRAALADAAELTNHLAHTHGLNGGAWT